MSALPPKADIGFRRQWRRPTTPSRAAKASQSSLVIQIPAWENFPRLAELGLLNCWVELRSLLKKRVSPFLARNPGALN